jgi:hypothetical protein
MSCYVMLSAFWTWTPEALPLVQVRPVRVINRQHVNGFELSCILFCSFFVRARLLICFWMCLYCLAFEQSRAQLTRKQKSNAKRTLSFLQYFPQRVFQSNVFQSNLLLWLILQEHPWRVNGAVW